jgi:hypothetical protein
MSTLSAAEQADERTWEQITAGSSWEQTTESRPWTQVQPDSAALLETSKPEGE